jgi:inner membrane protein
MPTIFTHPVIPLALGLGLGKRVIPAPLLLAGMLAAVLPDLDVIAFHLHVPYAHDFGHRGISHSLLFAMFIALLGTCAWKYFASGITRTFAFLFVAAASHGILDAFTNGGLGVALWWPFSPARYFAPAQVIEVSPLSMSRIFSARFIEVIISELYWVWLPGLMLMLALMLTRRYLEYLSPAALRSPH